MDDELARTSALLGLFDRFGELGQPTPPLRFTDRDPGREPLPGEDPYNAVIRFCQVKGSDSGPLVGWRIAVKDNVAVAGVPMTGGIRRNSVVPSEDASVVERLLAAGGTIVAKTNIGPSDFGATRNPHNPRFAPGGSSSGSAAAVAGGLADAALGADQGGSVRMPAAWCGIVGMKATYGLVPSYGLMYWDHTIDHVGPMTATVAANAAMLEVIAGEDGRNPQSAPNAPVPGGYGDLDGVGLKGVRIGVINEALAPSGCTDAVLDGFQRGCDILADLGAELVPVSVPLWTDAVNIWFAVLGSGIAAMDDSLGQGYGHLGRVDTDLLSDTSAQYLSDKRAIPLGRTLLLVIEHIRQKYGNVPLAQAANLRTELRRQIDELLADVDVLITPTMPHGPSEIDAGRPIRAADTYRKETWRFLCNTCAFNLTGHPALTVPAFPIDNDMPNGLQIIGQPFDERTVYQVGFAFEAGHSTRHATPR